jgi:hypothetical protein
VQRRVADRSVEGVLDEVFGLPATRYVHLRNAEVGCFIARVDRAPSN